jgi:prepilin-type processing-associated H-X9-DG protein
MWPGFWTGAGDKLVDPVGNEKWTCENSWKKQGSRASGAWTAGGPATVRGLNEDDPYLAIDGQFGGIHRGGANVLFADASVRFFPESGDSQMFKAMATVLGSKRAELLDKE